MLLNYGVGKDSSDPLHCKKIQPVHPKGDQSWVFIGRTDVVAEAPILWPPDEELTHLKRPWCWERLRAGGERDDRGWVGWMALPTRRTWVWASSRSWWWTVNPGVLQSVGLQTVGDDWVTELNGTESRILREKQRCQISMFIFELNFSREKGRGTNFQHSRAVCQHYSMAIVFMLQFES